MEAEEEAGIARSIVFRAGQRGERQGRSEIQGPSDYQGGGGQDLTGLCFL